MSTADRGNVSALLSHLRNLAQRQLLTAFTQRYLGNTHSRTYMLTHTESTNHTIQIPLSFHAKRYPGSMAILLPFTNTPAGLPAHKMTPVSQSLPHFVVVNNLLK
jgi:hypothetical protein